MRFHFTSVPSAIIQKELGKYLIKEKSQSAVPVQRRKRMLLTAITLSLCLNRPLPLIQAVINESLKQGASPLEMVCLVEKESRFNPKARSTTRDKGLFQLNEDYHPNAPSALKKHIAYGISYYLRCTRSGQQDLCSAYAEYNGGRNWKTVSIDNALRVVKLFNELMPKYLIAKLMDTAFWLCPKTFSKGEQGEGITNRTDLQIAVARATNRELHFHFV
jgi:hypothetical protein